MDEPMYRVWMQESVPPKAHYDERPGRWVAEPSWPSPNIAPQEYALAPGRLTSLSPSGSSLSPSGLTRGSMPPARDESALESVDARGDHRVEPEGRSGHDRQETSRTTSEAGLAVRTPQFLGTASGSWCGFGANADAPWDQRADDGMAVCFETEPLAERLEILGAPVLTLEVSSDRPNALLCARLCDVAHDGASLRVTYGLLNLTHREQPRAPRAARAGAALHGAAAAQ